MTDSGTPLPLRAWWSTEHDHSRRCWWNWEIGRWICAAGAGAPGPAVAGTGDRPLPAQPTG